MAIWLADGLRIVFGRLLKNLAALRADLAGKKEVLC